MQLKVIKADGSSEGYLHTKIIGTISNALAHVDQSDSFVSEQLAEVVTYFLYHEQKRPSVTSGEIFFIIEAVLMATGYEEAAIALSEHHFGRKLKRSRIEVVSVDIQELSDAEALCRTKELGDKVRWNKSVIVVGLMARYGVNRQMARAIAAMVEEKMLNMGATLVPASLIKQLVLSDTAAVLRAQRQLQTV